MRNFLNAIKEIPHAEERPRGWNAATSGAAASGVLSRKPITGIAFCCARVAPDTPNLNPGSPPNAMVGASLARELLEKQKAGKKQIAPVRQG